MLRAVWYGSSFINLFNKFLGTGHDLQSEDNKGRTERNSVRALKKLTFSRVQSVLLGNVSKTTKETPAEATEDRFKN